MPVSKAEYDWRTSPEGLAESLEDVWRESVREGMTTLGLEDWCHQCCAADGDDLVFDFSYSNLWGDIREALPEYADENAFPVFECIGGGRMFRAGEPPENLIRPDLWALIEEAETP
jgi:hypothetical protein